MFVLDIVLNNPIFHGKYYQNHNITFQDILAHPEIPWDMDWVSITVKYEFQDVLNHLDWRWNWKFVSKRFSITIQNVLDHPELPWNWEYLSINRNMTIDVILAHLDFPWRWDGLSNNACINWQDVCDNFHLPWDFDTMSTQYFSGCLRNHNYISKLNKNLQILCDLPKYIQMEIMEDKTTFSFYQLYHL